MWQRSTIPIEAPLDGFGHQHALADSMDISRPDLKVKKRRRQAVTIATGVVVLAAVTFLVMRLKPAAPNVDRSAVWTDTVKRGPMVVQVRGLGTLVPREDAIRQIPAQTEATVVRIRTLPGSIVKPDTVLVELNDPTLSQEAIDAELSLKEARAERQDAVQPGRDFRPGLQRLSGYGGAIGHAQPAARGDGQDQREGHRIT